MTESNGFDLSPTQRERVDAVLRFARSRLSPGARERDAKSVFDRGLWTEAAEFGLTGLPIPEEWGGGGLDAVDTMLVIEALGRGCEDGGLVFSLCAHMFASAVPIWRSGATELHERYLRDLAAGKIICANGTSEPEAGSDVHAMKATARRDGGGYVLEGTKCFITNAPVADLFLIYAKTNPTAGFMGVSAFLVPRATQGLRVVPEHGKTGLRTSPWGTIYLEECRVSERDRLGPEGCGRCLVRRIDDVGALLPVRLLRGAMARSLEQCIDHARSRKPVRSSHRRYQSIAESHRGHETATGNQPPPALPHWRAAPSRQALRRRGGHVQVCGSPRRPCSRGWTPSRSSAARAWSTDTGVDALLRDAMPAQIFSGTSEMQRMIIARAMGLF
jgi:alkylation response protein AidB-like acyl-CoA dehydrogenase